LIILLNTNTGLLADQVPKINPQTRTAIVDKVSDILAKNYLFPEKGKKMGAFIREKLKNGDYDKITDMKKLAEQLTSDLLLTSYFFNSEAVHLGDIYSRRTNTTRQFWTSPYVTGKRLPNMDLYILTSRRTFSAAEEFTYDLKHLNRATIIGESTGGGAHMVTRMIVNDYIYMFVPFTGAINPRTKTNWEAVGVKPHISIPEKKAFQVAYLTALKKCAEKATYKKWKEYLQSIIQDLDKKIDE
jgi:hypothetical protein